MEENKKKVYQKPEIQEVKLVPEEAVLTACKTTSSAKSGRSTNCLEVNFIKSL
ncbi:MAG: hypothetical protein HZB79_09250 [Deltaproteobacteria bacterium]|nr:hypothetical protein [Deltaproteobacteria bacterium]